MIVLGGIGGAIIVALVIGFIKNGISAKGMGKAGGAAVSPRRFSGMTFRRMAGVYGLSREQRKLLEFVFRNDDVTDPERVMADKVLLDRHFKRAYRTIEQGTGSSGEIQARLVKLFVLRNAIEAAPSSGELGKISENMAAVLFTGRDSFPVKVLSTKGGGILVENPRNALGTPIRIPKGSRVTLSFLTKASSGFSYESRVTDTPALPREGKGLLLVTIGRPKALAQRKFKRKQAVINCSFSFVIESKGKSRRRGPKLVLDRRRFSGTILDISVGGCSLKTTTAIQAGSLLKMEIDSPRAPLVACLGRVLRINRSGSQRTVIHIKFVKVPRRAYNAINMLVFGYDED
jgi:hypothetical protein